ncbi:hypothetical protein OIV83_006364 [Microbotryomycetes sp. JL201]|nr:hypothetical protein OIV83_006364 [Microbotryomycetes sp. JL201]
MATSWISFQGFAWFAWLSLVVYQVRPANGLPKRAPPTVKTSDGTTWIGKQNLDIENFLGMPFAEPPLGNLRFAPPKPLTKGFGTFDASQYGYSCPQMLGDNTPIPAVSNLLSSALTDALKLPIFVAAGGNASEDCLTINVQRPAGTTSKAKLPIMAFIYGGAFELGASATYDGSSIVRRSMANKQPVIYVSFNYRLNSFGFLPGKEVASDPTTSVNAGLLDQRLALEWVAKNIAQFGGDPDKVTIFGESAGAISIGFQLIAYDGNIASVNTGRPLFRAAIMDSGAPIPVLGPENGQASFDVVARETGCSTASDKIACLRAVPYQKLLDATNKLPGIFSVRSVSLAFLPRTDGKFLPRLAQEAARKKTFARVPIISGNQFDEGTILALGTYNITTDNAVKNWLRDVWFPRTTDAQRTKMLELYPRNPTQGSPFDTGLLYAYTPQNKRISAMVGDFVFQAERRILLKAAQGIIPTWSYVSRALRATPFLGTFHGSDLLSLFFSPLDPATEIQSRYIAFANNLDPNVPGYPYWPQYGTNQTLLQFTDTKSSSMFDTYRKDAIAFWGDNADVLSL